MTSARNKQWEYCLAIFGMGNEIELLNDYGVEGWELVAVIDWGDVLRAFFKRPVNGSHSS